jgi:hypothetical protein
MTCLLCPASATIAFVGDSGCALLAKVLQVSFSVVLALQSLAFDFDCRCDQHL